MRDNLVSVIVSRKWQLAEGYDAVQLLTRSRSEVPPFADGACVTLVLDHADYKEKTYPLCCTSSRPRGYVVAVRQQDGDTDTETATAPFNQGDEAFVGMPSDPEIVLNGSGRSLLFAAGVGAALILGIARRLASANQTFELHNFARSPERAVFRNDLDALRSQGEVHQHFGSAVEQLRQTISHVLSPTHANTQIYCSGPPSFMDLIERQAREWVYADNVHKLVLGHGTMSKSRPVQQS